MARQRIKMSSFRSGLAGTIDQVRLDKSRFYILRHGEPVGVLMSVEELAELDRLRSVYTTLSGIKRPI